jgi:hypothetical protein
MATPAPRSLTVVQRRVRLDRIARIAGQLGFAGSVEYRHVFSKSGGAQSGRGRTEEDDMLIVYAEAFDRDAKPDDFSLTAILAHERGHQLLARHPRIAKQVAGKIAAKSEEILAATLGSILCQERVDQENLELQAAAILADCGENSNVALERVRDLRKILEAML